jgi:hypothetical protein
MNKRTIKKVQELAAAGGISADEVIDLAVARLHAANPQTHDPAKGMKGVLCLSDGNPFFRQYHENGRSFQDFEIRHQDLEIEITDEDAHVYLLPDGEPFIDIGPASGIYLSKAQDADSTVQPEAGPQPE